MNKDCNRVIFTTIAIATVFLSPEPSYVVVVNLVKVFVQKSNNSVKLKKNKLSAFNKYLRAQYSIPK